MPREMRNATDKSRRSHALMMYGMWACCAVMLVPVVGFLVAGGTAGGLTQKLVAFAPLLLCVAAHLVMHSRMMGNSCHGASDEVDDSDGRTAKARRIGIASAAE